MCNSNERDVIVVGAGAAGAAVTWRLSSLGFNVTCFDQGRRFSPNEFPSNYSNWELLKLKEFNPNPNIRQSIFDYPINNNGSPIEIANFNAVGGSTVLFSGHYPRFHESDFKVFSEDGVGDDWPFSYVELQPYYDLNESVLNVSGLVGDPAYPEIKKLAPPIPIGKIGEIIGSACNELGWHWWPSYSAINTSRTNERNSCINLGPCNSGCSQAAKSSADVTYIPLAEKLGAEILSESRVTRILARKDQTVSGVEFIDKNGVICTVSAKIVVLAASGIGTPRLLLNSNSEYFPNGLANSSGLVGKRLMLHPLAYIEGQMDYSVDSNWGPQGCSILSQEFYNSPDSGDFKRGYTFQLLRGPGPVEWSRSRLSRKQLKWGAEHHHYFQNNFNRSISLAAIIEDLPDRNNYVELDPILKDNFGIPAPKINYSLSENSKKLLSEALRNGKILLEKAGAKNIITHAPVRNSGWHVMGTACMGKDPSNSVVDSNGRAHDVKNLFIADSSVFVTSSGVNPANTIQALALKIGDAVASQLRESRVHAE